MKRLMALVLLLALIVGVLAGCTSSAESNKPATSSESTASANNDADAVTQDTDAASKAATTYVGCLVTLSGTIGAWAGESVINGMKLAEDMINADGGVLGTKIEVLNRDDEGTASTMSSEFEKLVSNYNIAAAFGVTTGNVSTPFNECLERYHLPGLQFGGLMIDVNGVANGEGYDTKFAITSCDDTWALCGYDYVVNGLGCKKLYITGTDGITHDENVSVYQQMADMDGVEIVGIDPLPSSTSDFSSVILKMLASDADCVINLDGSDFGANFNKQAYELGLMDQCVVYNSGIPGIETMKALPQEVLQKTYWGGDFYFGYDNAATKEFADTYKAAFGEYPMDYAYYGYAALKIWASACEKAGTFDTDPVVNVIETTSGDFGAGEMKFSWAHNCQGTYYVMTGKTDEELAAGDADDFMKVVTTKSGEQYSITKEEAMSYPVVLSTNR